ncbi:MFS transporter [Thermocatellispora tengchongensis]|uniref:MFS transporter n=1 Tax=Thermocatellispora tengchongensis TaxID=1073253 RepID=UPI001C84BF14
MPLPAAALRSFRHRNYRLWAFSDIVSVTGTWMQVLGVNWMVLSATGSATSVGLSLVLQALPTLVLGMWGGALADRLPSRPVIVVSQVTQAVLAALLAMIALGGTGSVAAVYAIVLVSGVVSALTGPAFGRFGAEVVPPEDLPNSLALGSLINSAGRILGMSLAGVLMPLTGPAWLFLINAITFFAVVACVLVMRADEMHTIPLAAASGTHPGGVRAGLAYVLRTPWLLVMLALALVLGSLGRNYQVTMAAMSAGPLGAGAAGYGVLSTVFAVGTVLGGVFAAGRSRLTLRLLLVTAGVVSAAQAVSGLMPDVMTFGALMLPIAAGAVIIDTTVGTRAQLDSPPEMRGRIIAVNGIVGAAAGAIGGPLLGVMSDTMGPRGALHLAGVVTVAATLLAAAAFVRTRARARTSPAPVLPAAAPAAAVEPVG